MHLCADAASATTDATGFRVHRLPHDQTAAATARHVVREMMSGMDDSVVDDAVVMVSELVTNAVVHGHPTVELGLRVQSQRLDVRVHDGADVFDVNPERPSDSQAHGRGLLIVAALAQRWGLHSEPRGKVVWFELGCGAASC